MGAGWLIAGRTLRPLQEITSTARRVADDRSLHRRIALEGPRDELRELADTFDAMLECDAFATPLAVTLATNERSERLLEGLLTLASSGNELHRRDEVDLADVVTRSVEQVAGEAARREVTLSAPTVPALVEGDGLLLERLVLNLVQNGVRHNGRGGHVDVEIWRAGDRGGLTVTNTGPVVPP